MKKIFTFFLICIVCEAANGQNVGIGTNTPHASAIVDMSSTSKGVLLPRMSTAQRIALLNPAAGLLVFDLDKNSLYMYDGSGWYALGFVNEQKIPVVSKGPKDQGYLKSFGNSVAISGDYAIIGAKGDSVSKTWWKQGSAYIFTKTSGTWVQQAKLSASDGKVEEFFGTCVAIDGNYAIVSSYNLGNNKQGAVYVFVRNGNNWTQQAKLTANDIPIGHHYGTAISISGNYIIVGASSAEINGNSGQGAAYIYKRTNNTWALQNKLIANDGAANDFFGGSVSISGDYAVIGAYNATIGGNSGRGCAYIFVQGGGTWTQQQKIFDLNGKEYGVFGYNVSISGDYVVCSQPGFKYAGISIGSFLVFKRSGNVWQDMTGSISANNYDINSSLSGGISISGNYIIAGSTVNSAAYLFRKNNDDEYWTQVRELREFDYPAEQYGFGAAVGINGFNCVVGNPLWLSSLPPSSGRVSFVNFQ